MQGLETVVASRFGFAHHQKTVILDQEVGGQRWLTAFMGVFSVIFTLAAYDGPVTMRESLPEPLALSGLWTHRHRPLMETETPHCVW